MLKKYRPAKIFCLLIMLVMIPLSANASDLDIYASKTINESPNVLIILDISGSMDTVDVEDSEGLLHMRMDVAKQAVTKAIESNPRFRWGLMTFPNVSGTDQSGELVAHCMTRDDAQTSALIATINNLDMAGGTPVASALAEAGLYFAGKNSFFWSTKYESPIETVCQQNYIILLTDGFSSIDSGVKGGFTSTSTTKYNMNAAMNSIFLEPNISARSPYMDHNERNFIGDYITYRTNHTDPGKQIDLGSRLSDFVTEDYWTADTNNKIKGTLNHMYTSGYSAINWARVESGSPTLGYSKLGTWRQLAAAYNANFKDDDGNPTITPANMITTVKLVADGIPYISGYNANDPSRPFPPLTFSYTGVAPNINTILNLAQQGYLEGTQIYQNNVSGDGVYGNDYLDDVAAYLNYEDMRSDLGIPGKQYEKQTVQTFVIGFTFSTDLLHRTAIMGGTDDRYSTYNGPEIGDERRQGYFFADSHESLALAFAGIAANIREMAVTFVSPTVPSSSDNRGYAGDYMYFAFFMPKANATWMGNLKKYYIEDTYLTNVLKTSGTFRDDAQSEWSDSPDGKYIDRGGAYERIKNQLAPGGEFGVDAVNRKVYTYTDSVTDLSHKNNWFEVDNNKIKADLLSIDPALRESIITTVRQSGLGAIIHSQPEVVRYGEDDSVVYIGSNDGFLHAIDDETGKELWAFIVPDHLDTIANAASADPLNGDYYVDGSPGVLKYYDSKILVTGLRRGGYSYTALNVNNYNAPSWLYSVKDEGSNTFLGNNDYLGFSWSKPQLYAVSSGLYSGTAWVTPGDSSLNVKIKGDVRYDRYLTYTIILSGGYDPQYDELPSESVSNPKGASILAFHPSSGSKTAVFNGLRASQSDLFRHSVIAVAPFDLNFDGVVETLYFGDQGGNLFYAAPYTKHYEGSTQVFDNTTGDFVPYILFRPTKTNQKIQYAPDVVLEGLYDHLVYFGTGDREDPTDQDAQNAFYCVNNRYLSRLSSSTSDTNYLTEADLVDLSDNLMQHGTDEQKAEIQANLNDPNKFGWYIDLQKGEKVTSSPIVYGKTVYFTTFMPSATEKVDECSTFTSGRSRLYALDHKTAVGKNNKEGEEGEEGEDQNRFVEIGEGLSTAPVIVIFGDTVMLYVGGSVMGDGDGSGGGGSSGGSIGGESLDMVNDFELYRNAIDKIRTDPIYYWKQVF